MKILFVAQNIDHHKVPFVEELIKYAGEENVRYATPVRIEQRRINMGFPVYENMNWLLEINHSTQKEFEDWFGKSDIVICNIREYYQLMEKRLSQQKLTFYFSERWFKAGIGKARLLHPKIIHIVYRFRKLSAYPSFFYLAQGQYAADDFKSIGLCKGHIFNFGYFTSIKKSISVNRTLPTDKINILWCGRMMKCKRVDTLVKAFSDIIKIRKQVHLTIVGEGSQQKQIDRLIKKLPEGSVTRLKLLPTQQVRELMSEADIYVFPSNGFEGWGAVVNEAMAEKCTIIGSNKAGAIKTMIEHNKNGLIFSVGNHKVLERQLLYLIDNPSERKRLQQAAYKSITTEWSPENVCKRFLQVSNAIINNSSFRIYNSGAMKLL